MRTLRSLPVAAAALSLCFLAGTICSRSAFAGDTAAAAGKPIIEAAEGKPLGDRIWALPTLYKNDDSSFLNEFRLVGRAHFDAFTLDSDVGSNEDWIVRRLRIGAKARFFHNLYFHTEVDLNAQNPDPLYSRLTEANLAWKFNDAATLSVGKLGVNFTLDGATSSNELLTINRSNLSNNLWFPTRYFSGVAVNGKIGQWQYNTGYFSSGTETPEFGNFDAGYFWLGSVGYNFGKALGVKKALLRADYVYNDPNLENNATRPFEQIGALVFQLDAGRWGFSAEVDGGVGFGTQSDVWGVNVMPWFNITKQLQAAGRYTYVASQDPGGVRMGRYDTTVTSRRGDEYSEIYGGLNYYVYGHRLKVQTGVSYVSLAGTPGTNDEYHAWQWTTSLRISF